MLFAAAPLDTGNMTRNSHMAYSSAHVVSSFLEGIRDSLSVVAPGINVVEGLYVLRKKADVGVSRVLGPHKPVAVHFLRITGKLQCVAVLGVVHHTAHVCVILHTLPVILRPAAHVGVVFAGGVVEVVRLLVVANFHEVPVDLALRFTQATVLCFEIIPRAVSESFAEVPGAPRRRHLWHLLDASTLRRSVNAASDQPQM